MSMYRPKLNLRRPLSQVDRANMIYMEATIGRTVGTHVGSPLSLKPVRWLGFDVIPPHALHSAATSGNMSKTDFMSEVERQLPESCTKAIIADVLGVEFVEYGKLYGLSLVLGSAALQQERESVYGALREISGVSVAKTAELYVPFGVVGLSDAPALSEALAEYRQHQISLEPIPTTQSVDSPQQQFGSTLVA